MILEEVYAYRISRPRASGCSACTPATASSTRPTRCTTADVVLVPKGYHPFVAAHGYDCYYLNALAGDVRSMAASDDPDLAWVRGAWESLAPGSARAARRRLPMSIRVATAPVSYGVFELTVDGASDLPDGDALAADDGRRAATSAPSSARPATSATGAEVARDARPPRARARRLVPAVRFSRAELFAEDLARLDETLDLLDEARRRRAAADRAALRRLLRARPDAARRRDRGSTPRPGSTTPASRLLVENVHRAAERCRERGFAVSFHYHAGTYVETPREIARFAERMDGSLLGLCFDTGHSAFGGGDPLELLRDHGELVNHVHLKDVDLPAAARPPRARATASRRPGRRACSARSARAGGRRRRASPRCVRTRLRRLARRRAGPGAAPGGRSRTRSTRAREPRVAARARAVTHWRSEIGRHRRLDALSGAQGVFAVAAIDHRDALTAAHAKAGLEKPTREQVLRASRRP